MPRKNRPASARAATLALAFVSALSAGVAAQSSDAPPPSPDRPWEITDNSFLVEEAFNQEPGVVQNIFGLHAARDGTWQSAFTQEWPVRVQAHQFSYTVAFARADGGSGLGDVALHYRLQVLDEAARRPAFSPRVSLVLPTGNAARGLGAGSAGWEINLPFSKRFRDIYLHWNAGFTHLPAAGDAVDEHDLLTPRVAASGIWRVRPMFNVMLESVVEWAEESAGAATERTRRTTLVPGFRAAWPVGEAQTVAGLGLPIRIEADATAVGVFGYLSYELPFLSTR